MKNHALFLEAVRIAQDLLDKRRRQTPRMGRIVTRVRKLFSGRMK
jgi:hypothetical protein